MRFFKETIYFIISSVLVLLVCEFFVRSSNLGQVSSTEFVDELGRAKRKNMDFVYFNEGFGVVSYNEHGFLGNSVEIKKRDNLVRIALVGDSFVESLQVFSRDYFGKLAEDLLNNDLDDRKYEILNMGRSGFVFPDMYIYQKVYVENFNPDKIFYFISLEDLTAKNNDPLLPKLMIDTISGSPIIDVNYNKEELRAFMISKKAIQNSALLNMTNIARKRLKNDYMGLLFGKFGQRDPKKASQETNSLTSDELKQVKRSIGILDFIDPSKAIFINRDSIALPQSFTGALKNKGFKYYDLGETLKLQTKNVFDPNYWNVTNKRGHWNHAAHKVLAKELAKIIEDNTLK
ncbi:hypothetical protein RQM59_13695 [Flavobacteriaceae bacterium S356]|uniref:SGNH/GDSL hydrolase family protein n=1 Tax=Asprobacillus argus TaxID=3076534 RepID=A0ABU3LI78_9FLAO|nr:hypothetical protein [Flavobacteriaceae bacterium S356]